MNAYAGYFVPNSIDATGNKAYSNCADAYKDCKKLRDTWDTVGKTFSTALMDLFLGKKRRWIAY